MFLYAWEANGLVCRGDNVLSVCTGGMKKGDLLA